jgi:hypothetical protein
VAAAEERVVLGDLDRPFRGDRLRTAQQRLAVRDSRLDLDVARDGPSFQR